VDANKGLPCRLNIQLEGVQAFLYNRSPAYDAIVEHVNQATEGGTDGSFREEVHAVSTGSETSVHKPSMIEKLGHRIRSSIVSKTDQTNGQDESVHEKNISRANSTVERPTIPSWLRLFPIHVGCKTAAAVLGNENTKSIITVKVDRASGCFDAGHAGPLDIYKLLFQFEFEHPVIHMKPNLDFKELQLATAVHLKMEHSEEQSKKPSKKDPKKKKGHWYTLGYNHSKSSESVKAASMGDSRRVATSHIQAGLLGEERWQGLSRYLDENMLNEHGEWDAVEYGKSSTLADCPRIGMTFYWDIPGPVPQSVDNLGETPPGYDTDVNGTLPPEYGLDLQVHGGTINYGPWADRQRINFQSIFFPSSYADTIPGKKLAPGELRISTVFKIFVSIEADTTLRIPVREPSKDWKWKGKAETVAGKTKDAPNNRKGKRKDKKVPFWKSRDKGKSGPNVRPFAWLDVKVATNSTVNYTMDMIARQTGYRSNVDADVKSLEISTSVNHGLLWRSGALTLDCDLSTPLGWNTLREWRFKIINDDLELFILRDHLFLLTDVITDWTSGPPSEYFTFAPFRYLLDVRFRNFKLYLNTNDSNIINDPSDPDRNQFIILHGRDLHADVIVPLESFRPIRNEIFFDVVGSDLDLQLCLSPTNTVAAFVGPKKIAQLDEVTLKGSHAYFSQTSIELTDRLTFNIHGNKPKIFLFGFVVDRLIKLKENYFGEDLHFRTLDEFQDLSHGRELAAESDAKAQQSNRSNDLDVILCISSNDVRALIPANLYSADESIAIDIPYASADLRLTNYYMDLQVDFSPMTVSHSTVVKRAGSPKLSNSRTEIFIESANMAGHRLFGLPPTEPTYVCSWDIDVGHISGGCSSTFFEQGVRALKCFAFTLDDDENSMPLVQPLIIPDITFLRVRTQDVRVWLHIDTDAFLISTGPASVDLNDLAGPTFSDRLKVFVPDFTVACVDANSASRHRIRSGRSDHVKTHAYLRTTLSLSMLKRKLHFIEERQKQQDHLLESDSRTNRTPFLLLGISNSLRPSAQRMAQDPPATAYPPLPEPLSIQDQASGRNHGSFVSSNSFLGKIAGGDNVSSDASSFRSFRAPKLSTRSSRSSLAASIRSGRSHSKSRSSKSVQHQGRSPLPSQSPGRTPRFPSEQDRERRGLPPTSVAFSSSLAAPYFPLNIIEPDRTELPSLPQIDGTLPRTKFPEFGAATGRDLDENLVHTSLIINVNPGIQLFFSPSAVTAVATLVDLLLPKTHENILDAFQIDVVGELLGLEKRKQGAGNSIEISAQIPSISMRFLNVFSKEDHSGPHAEVDQYDLDLTQLALVARHTVHPVAEKKNNLSLLHCTLKSLAVSVKEKYLQGEHQDVAIGAQIDDSLLWMAVSDKASLNFSFRDLSVATASRKVEYLAAIVHRTTLLANDFAATFAEQQARRKERLAYLAYGLTMGGSDVADPPFLNRTSHVLRVAPHHIRNHDSWKIISRFRYIFENMPDETRPNLEDASLCPKNAAALVIKSWDEWRTWDLAHVKRSRAMQHIYGPVTDPDGMDSGSPTLPIELQVRSSSLKFLIDPGPKQTEFAVHTLTISLTSYPSSGPSGLMLMQATEDTPTDQYLVEVSSSAMVVRLNWEIIGLVENLITMFKDGDPLKKVKPEPSILPVSATPRRPKIWREIQGIVTSESALVAFDTPNLNALAASNALKLSLIGRDKSSTGQGLFLSALVHANSAHSELRSHSRLLARAQADDPNLYLSQDDPGVDSPKQKELRVAGISTNIVLESKEELLVLVEAVDLVVRNEAADLKQRFGNLDQSESLRQTIAPDPTSTRLPKLTVALLMDAYRVDVALLQSLNYTLSGKVGRISVVPNLQQLLSLHVDLDLNGHSHELTSHANSDRHVISTVTLPPINAHIKILRKKERTYLTVSTIIETIVLEASAIHGLLTTMNRPEISKTFSAVKTDVETLERHIQDIFPSSPHNSSTPISTPSQSLAYRVDVTLAGIRVIAEAPGKLPDAGVASLSLGLNCVQLTAFNYIAEDDGDLLPLPEIHTQLRQLFVELVIRDKMDRERRCGNLALSASVHCTLRSMRRGQPKRNYRAQVDGIVVNVFAETASAVVDVLNDLQDKLKDVDLSRERKYLQRFRQPSRKPSLYLGDSIYSDTSVASVGFFQSAFSLSLLNIQISWIVGNSVPAFAGYEVEDLVLSIKLIDLSTKSENSSTLSIQDVMLQMVPGSQSKQQRSMNSARLPEMIFNVGYASTEDERKISLQAVGKSFELLLDSKFVIPASLLQRSIGLAVDKFREATASWEMVPTSSGAQRKNPFGDKRLASLLVDADFAGAVVRLQGRGRTHTSTYKSENDQATTPHGRYGQFLVEEHVASAEMRTPGIAIKVEYTDTGSDSSVNAELKVDGSSNELTPTVVPLILEISDSVKTVVGETEKTPLQPSKKPETKAGPASSLIDEGLLTADPSQLLGKTSFNLGVRIRRQEFSLSCQPIARVVAYAHLEDIYITANSVKSAEHDHFIAVSANFENLQASIQHIYSRESTFSFEVESVVLSIMNSKHLSGTAGLSAVLKINPMRTQINARQLQDFLLFREIWIPPEIRKSPSSAHNASSEPQDYLVQRYQQVASATAFPWTATVAIEELKVELDLGQAIGKSSLIIENVWASSRKDSNWEQNLCIGIGKVGINSTGRMSGFVELAGVKVRTMIAWPEDGPGQTPSIQASAGFDRLRVKAAFDYQAFAIVDIAEFDFVMYNVRPDDMYAKDRLVAILDGDKVNVFFTAVGASQGLALFQAVERLVQENQGAYAQSLKDIEKFLRRESSVMPTRFNPQVLHDTIEEEHEGSEEVLQAPITLYTDVVVTLRAINVGAFPRAFYDSQIFLIEASDVQARFAATVDNGKVHCGLGTTLGQLQVALTSVAQPTGVKTIEEITVDDVVNTATTARGGTILRVPKVIATMQTWQTPGTYQIDYVFKSRFEGKVDVGWNYSRISFIRDMYERHARSLASRLGKPLPESAVKITTGGQGSSTGQQADGTEGGEGKGGEGEKITAVVNVPQSRYEYHALEPPIIETPQLRDMGEATPPLEWIGLQRDRLPNVTHQIVIVALLGVVREVEEAYGRILGST
jgi:hypothetical protein